MELEESNKPKENENKLSKRNQVSIKIEFSQWNQKFSNFLNQIIGALAISLATMNLGTVSAYVTETLPQLQCKNVSSDVFDNCIPYLDDESGSWFASTEYITGMFLCPIGGILSGKIGRKSTLLVTTPLIIVGFIVLALAKSTALIFIGWMLCTMSVNLNFSSAGNFHYHVSSYNGEHTINTMSY